MICFPTNVLGVQKLTQRFYLHVSLKLKRVKFKVCVRTLTMHTWIRCYLMNITTLCIVKCTLVIRGDWAVCSAVVRVAWLWWFTHRTQSRSEVPTDTTQLLIHSCEPVKFTSAPRSKAPREKKRKKEKAKQCLRWIPKRHHHSPCVAGTGCEVSNASSVTLLRSKESTHLEDTVSQHMLKVSGGARSPN